MWYIINRLIKEATNNNQRINSESSLIRVIKWLYECMSEYNNCNQINCLID
jgi:hypothetical protein